MTAPFLLDRRCCVYPDTNEVEDRVQGTTTRIEPRQMKLLCALAAQPGGLVDRDHLISTLWDNYGGADDAITQAISVLRKVLRDDGKRLIETVPKSGYILRASVQPMESVPPDKKVLVPPKAFIIAAAVVAVLVAVFWLTRSNDAIAPPAPEPVTGPHQEQLAPPAP